MPQTWRKPLPALLNTPRTITMDMAGQFVAGPLRIVGAQMGPKGFSGRSLLLNGGPGGVPILSVDPGDPRNVNGGPLPIDYLCERGVYMASVMPGSGFILSTLV